MKQLTLLFCFISFFAVITTSCKESGFKNMKEGEVYYSIRYIKNPSSLPPELLPKELVISFKNDKMCSELRTPFGGSGISTVVDPKAGVYDTYLNMLTLKLYYEGKEKDIQPGFSYMKIASLKETGNSRDIAGYKCKEVQVKLEGSDSARYVWYTNEIKVDDPNQHTPYKDIDGVLMDFFYIIGQADMAFTADAVFAKEVPEKNFEKKKNYRQVSCGYLDSLIVKMISY